MYSCIPAEVEEWCGPFAAPEAEDPAVVLVLVSAQIPMERSGLLSWHGRPCTVASCKGFGVTSTSFCALGAFLVRRHYFSDSSASMSHAAWMIPSVLRRFNGHLVPNISGQC